MIAIAVSSHIFDSAPLIIRPHSRARRWIGIGVNIPGVIVVVFTRLGSEGCSIISMRPASRDERKLYYENC